MIPVNTEKKIHYTLRFAAAMCFIGHGAFGIITKQIWFNYFAVFGIGHTMANTLMPLVGVADITMGISLLVYPTRAVLLWLVVWGLITAALRPLSGEPFAELLERAGNYGAPLILLLIHQTDNKNRRQWFECINPNITINQPRRVTITIWLKMIVFLLLIGHGWLNLIGKTGLLYQYSTLGFSNPPDAARLAGIFEITAAVFILIKPYREMVMLLLVWKMATELIYPHLGALEWIERGGSYGALLALWFVTRYNVTVVSFKPMAEI